MNIDKPAPKEMYANLLDKGGALDNNISSLRIP